MQEDVALPAAGIGGVPKADPAGAGGPEEAGANSGAPQSPVRPQGGAAQISYERIYKFQRREP
ncbi:hypothetical protein [Sediminispirochaeta bajacaliforniensis]|uniref:hypothetical protein n=1 Tax=Sediminispirochaeta bajacaliforniensis TaxID=148 RepID=UPI00037B7104|nr:hypothetical protein [Sediminispirochaeta bajacaliforniensis]